MFPMMVFSLDFSWVTFSFYFMLLVIFDDIPATFFKITVEIDIKNIYSHKRIYPFFQAAK